MISPDIIQSPISSMLISLSCIRSRQCVDHFIFAVRYRLWIISIFLTIATIYIYYIVLHSKKQGKMYFLMIKPALVQHCVINSELCTCYFCQFCVVVNQRCYRIASFLRLVLTKISGTLFTQCCTRMMTLLKKYGICNSGTNCV